MRYYVSEGWIEVGGTTSRAEATKWVETLRGHGIAARTIPEADDSIAGLPANFRLVVIAFRIVITVIGLLLSVLAPATEPETHVVVVVEERDHERAHEILVETGLIRPS